MADFRNSRSHRHQKLHRYTGESHSRRRHLRFSLWWIVPISAAVAFLLAILLGNCLGAKVPEPGNESESASQTEGSVPAPPDTVDVEELEAIFVGLEGVHDSTYDHVSGQIPDGTRAVSLSMFYSNGAPIYRSEVAMACGKPSGDLTLANVFKYPDEMGIYVSVPFQSTELASDEDASGHVRAAYEIALIKELAAAGADEVIVRCAPLGAQSADLLRDDRYMGRITDYLYDLRHEVPEIRIGFTVSASDAADPSLATAIDTLSQYADLIAVDMTGLDDPDSLAASVEPTLANLLRYKMRVLISGKSEELCSLLDSMNVKNRQTVIR